MTDNTHAVDMFFNRIGETDQVVADRIDSLLWEITDAWRSLDAPGARRKTDTLKAEILKLADRFYIDPQSVSARKDYVIYVAVVETLVPFAREQGYSLKEK
jgi:hypothetical protein